MKKVIYVGAFRFPAGDAAASRVLNNAKIFHELGYEVTFLSWGGQKRKKDLKSEGGYYYQNFRYINTDEIDKSIRNPITRTINYFFSGRKSLKLLKQSIDHETSFVIAYNPPFYFINRLNALCKKKQVKLIVDITEWYSGQELPGGRFNLPALLNELNMRFYLKRIKNKIVISSFLNKYYSSPHNIVLPPLVDSSELKWKSRIPNFPNQITNYKGIRLIYAGNPARKDLLGVMFAAVLNSINSGLSFQFIVLGVSKQDIKQNPKYNEIVSHSKQIILLGKVPQADVPLYYHISDFSILIRDITKKTMAGFPTKLVESMMAGIPVIVNYTSDLGNHIVDGENGFVIEDGTEQSLTKALSKLQVTSSAKINSMKVNAKFHAETQFDFSNYIDKMKIFLNNTHL